MKRLPELVDAQASGEASRRAPFASPPQNGGRVTARAFWLGLLLSAFLAALNCWIEILHNVHFLGGVQMPFGAIFGLLVVVLFVNGPLRILRDKAPGFSNWLPPFSSTELLTVYAMLLFAALLSTVGTDNFFLTTGPALFYFSTRENRWAEVFYDHVPTWWAPGWNGAVYQEEVIQRLYIGGLSFAEIPWHAWTMMLIGWGLFLVLTYATLFFLSLLLRRQWIENEALAFPLVQLPLQMVESAPGDAPPARAFWANRTLWAGVALALGVHLLRGMNNYFPDWPLMPSFHGNVFWFSATERPWNAAGDVPMPFFLGAIGIAYLLTREVSFSFWVFFLLAKYQLVMAQQLGFEPGVMPRDSYKGVPVFLAYQTVGGWLMLGFLLLWTARHHLRDMFKSAWRGSDKDIPNVEGEPISARWTLVGFAVSFAALVGWCVFAGMNPLLAVSFLALYALLSLVLARLVIEGGFLFPQIMFSPMEVISTFTGTAALGASNLTKISFLQPVLFSDMRTNVLPGFLHTLKIAYDQRLDTRHTRRLMGAVMLVVILTTVINIVVSITTLYSAGGLSGYRWFSQGATNVFTGTATAISSDAGINFGNIVWTGVGAIVVLLLTLARARFVAFPLHPLGFIVSTGFPLSNLWLSFFIGWLAKTLFMKYGGNDAVVRARPFFIGLILGNACAMVFWMLFGFWRGSQIGYWPA